MDRWTVRRMRQVRQAERQLTLVVRQVDRQVTLAKGSDRPEVSAAMSPLAWYMWHRSWNSCFPGDTGRDKSV